jgi:hypothetical protein
LRRRRFRYQYEKGLRSFKVALHLAEPVTYPAQEQQRRAVKRSAVSSWAAYTPTRYPGPVTLFAGWQTLRLCLGDLSLRWQRYLVGGFETRRVAGKHVNLFEGDNIEILGGEIRAALARVDADAGVPSG